MAETHLGDPFDTFPCNKVKMRCTAAYDGTKGNDGVVIMLFGDFVNDKGYLE
ncbi:hypothetical protein Thiowin_00007 [Thiorhodovibrio winogradskyi]|uniref:Uncharacterized protein n=1 Tax=Thiorhodovibrio winogradskyi TaxID=77007 RepID=A0ABZ0S170_9GAMM